MIYNSYRGTEVSGAFRNSTVVLGGHGTEISNRYSDEHCMPHNVEEKQGQRWFRIGYLQSWENFIVCRYGSRAGAVGFGGKVKE